MIQEIIVDVSFLKHTLTKREPVVTEGDYSSTKLIFCFEEKIEKGYGVRFKMSKPNGDMVLFKELDDLDKPEIILAGYDEEGNVFSLFPEAGLYPFELVLHSPNSKLTSAPGWLVVGKCQVDESQGEGAEYYLPLFEQALKGLENAVGQSTEEGGEVFNDYPNNKALTEYAHAEGTYNIAGGKAFSVLGVNSNTKTLTLDTVSGLEVGFVGSLYHKTNYEFFGTITAVSEEHNTVTFDSIPVKDVTETALLWIPEHPELGTVPFGVAAHAEGYNNKAVAIGAHVEGGNNIAAGKYAHVEGRNNIGGYASHVEGVNNQGKGLYCHVEGGSGQALEEYTHVEGYGNIASGKISHAEGKNTKALGAYSHAEGENTEAIGTATHTEGKSTYAEGNGTHAEGWGSKATGHGAHAEGYSTANGDYSHSEGYSTKASAQHSHAEGKLAVASGNASHAEGESTEASGQNSHAEGKNTKATKNNSHAEGTNCKATGASAHAEGWDSEASGEGAHAENFSKAVGKYSHSNGYGTVAGYDHQTVGGRYNANKSDNLFEIGNGSANSPSNAFEVKEDGSIVIGGVTLSPEQLVKLLALIGS